METTVGSWIAGIAVSAVIIGVCWLCGSFAEEDHAASAESCQHSARSAVVPYMANPVHNWHPANINHVYHR